MPLKTSKGRINKLSANWSPEQVSGWLKVEKALFISHERIYQHIWTDKLKGGTLYKHLRHLCPSEVRVQWQEAQAIRFQGQAGADQESS